MANLPEGFVPDEKQPELPAGFVPDAQQPKAEETPEAPEKPSFLQEASARAKGVVSPLVDLFKNATVPTSWEDVKARLRQNAPAAASAVGEGIVTPVRAALAANSFAARALTAPQTLGAADVREGLRGFNSNLPLANLAVEHLGGPPEVSPEDTAAAPGAREAGALAGAALVGKTGATAAERTAARLEKAGVAAEARGVERAVDTLAERTRKNTRLKLEDEGAERVHDLVREHPDVAKVAGDDAKLAPKVEKIKAHATGELGKIYSEAGAQDKGVDSAVSAIDNMDKRIGELRGGDANERKIAVRLQGIRDEFDKNYGSAGDFRVAKLRAEQSAYQKAGWAKNIANDADVEANIVANREASKAVGNAVVKHVTGMDYEAAKAAAETDPKGIAARLFKANDQVTAANRIEAGIADRAAKPQAGPGLGGQLLHFAKHARHNFSGALAAPAVELAARGINLPDRALAARAPGAAANLRAVAPVAAAPAVSGAFSPDTALRDLIARAGQGDEMARAKLEQLSKAPIVAARIDALSRQGGM